MYFWGHEAVADDRDRPRGDSMSHTAQSRWRTFIPGVTSEFTKTLQPLCKYEWCYFTGQTGQAALSKTHSDHRCSKASFQSGALQRVLRKYWVLNSRSEMIAFCHRGICLFSFSFFPFFFSKCAHWQSYSAHRTSPAMLVINNRKYPADVTWSVSALSGCVVAVKQRDSSVVKWTVSTLRTLFQGLNYCDVLLFIDLF